MPTPNATNRDANIKASVEQWVLDTFQDGANVIGPWPRGTFSATSALRFAGQPDPLEDTDVDEWVEIAVGDPRRAYYRTGTGGGTNVGYDARTAVTFHVVVKKTDAVSNARHKQIADTIAAELTPGVAIDLLDVAADPVTPATVGTLYVDAVPDARAAELAHGWEAVIATVVRHTAIQARS